MTLNPATDPYVPHSHWPQHPSGNQNFQQSHFDHTNVCNGNNSFSSSSPMMNSYQLEGQMDQIGHMSSFQNNHSYPPPPNMQGGMAAGALPPHFNHPPFGSAPSYGQYAPPVEQFPAYNSGYQIDNVSSAAPFAPMFPHMNAAQSFHVPHHPSGPVPPNVGQSWETNFSGHSLSNAHTIGVTTAPYNSYDQGSSFGAGPAATYKIENQNVSKFNTRQTSSASLHSKQSSVTNEETPRYNDQASAKKYENSSGTIQSKHSTIVAARTPRYSGPDTVKKLERRGFIRSPLDKAVQLVQSPSPERTIKKLMSISKLQHSHPVEIEDSRLSLKLFPTPSSKPNALGTDFNSEPRKNDGLSIRFRRGHTESSVIPKRKDSVFDWLKSTPDSGTTNLGESSGGRRRPSPPKMGLLAAGSAAASSLKTINEDDPFVYGPSDLKGKKREVDPFASMQAVVPYSKSSLGLVRESSGMSAQLRNLTSHGTRKPTFAEAADTKNLPFAEICRLSREDTWGVVKIKNVSFLLVVKISLITYRFHTRSIALKFSHSLVAMPS